MIYARRSHFRLGALALLLAAGGVAAAGCAGSIGKPEPGAEGIRIECMGHPNEEHIIAVVIEDGAGAVTTYPMQVAPGQSEFLPLPEGSYRILEVQTWDPHTGWDSYSPWDHDWLYVPAGMTVPYYFPW